MGIRKPENVIGDINNYFNTEMKPDWFTDLFVRSIIQEIDNIVISNDGHLESPVFGSMNSEHLSIGCKALILAYRGTPRSLCWSIEASCCSKLLEIVEQKDVYVYLKHYPFFEGDFKAEFLNSGVVTHNAEEFMDEFYWLMYSN